jgi:putative (di)nucleoside polyphosphate hydrolase
MASVRRAVAAVVVHKEKFLLAERIAAHDHGTLKQIAPEWDLIKGGVDDEDSRKAVLRELFEETGSREFAVLRQYPALLSYEFSPAVKAKIGYDLQETIVFLVRYDGDTSKLKPGVPEIGRLAFFTRDEAIAKLKYPETRDWFKKNVSDAK